VDCWIASRRTSIQSFAAGFGSLFAEVMHQGNAKGLHSSEIAIRPCRSDSATTLAPCGDAVGVGFWTAPDAMAETLPNGLSLDPEFKWSRRHRVFWIGKSQLRPAEYLQLARYHYREALILVDAMYRSLPVTCCPYTYVDNDAELDAAGRGSFQENGQRL
jgi:hypothetical protein